MNKIKNTVYLVILSLIVFSACKKESTIPEFTSITFDNLSETGFICYAVINDDGGTEITSKGFVWDTVTSPDLNSNIGFTENGTGTEEFSHDFTDLLPGTKYYVKSYATNEIGTSYGDELEITTNEPVWNGTSCTDAETITDIEGNVYRTVAIGDQCWLVENLKTSKLNDGTDLTNITTNSEWNSTSLAAYSWYGNDDSNKEEYGAFYNYYAVETDKLCPEGWHVATDDDWKELEGFVDSEYGVGNAEWENESWRGSDIGTKLKDRYVWPYGGSGTDDFGFEFKPNGYRDAVTGEFDRMGEWGTVWCHKNADEAQYFRRELSGNESKSARYNSNPRTGYAVRCIKD